MIKLLFNLFMNLITLGYWEKRLGNQRPEIRIVPQYEEVKGVHMTHQDYEASKE